MNWFQRYGIPGAYFVALSAAWLFALSPQARAVLDIDNAAGLVGSAAIVFLPIGYVISVLGQVIYLHWRRLFTPWPRIRGWLGVHGKAAERARVSFLDARGAGETQDEALIEAHVHLMTFRAALREGSTVNTHQFMRDWIARRMDVIAIDFSLFLSTLIAPVVAVIVSLSCQCAWWGVIWTVLGFSAVVIAVMVCSMRVLKRQVVQVIAGLFRRV